MTHLRQRRLEDLPRTRLSERTPERYVRAVRQLAEQDHQSPDRITEEERRDSCGLRRQDGTHLQVTDIDAARLCLHRRHGTGAKDRDVPLPPRPLPRLRASWLTPRHPVGIVPAPGRGGTGLATATQPLPRARVPDACRAALKASGLPTRASGHTRRHAWATQRREAGMNRRLMQASLGPHAPATTALDPHLPRPVHAMAAPSINRLREALSWSRGLRSSASTARSPGPRAGLRGRPAISGRWRPSHPVGPPRLAARSTRVTRATTITIATTPVSTATVPHATTALPMRGGTGHR